MKILGQVSPAGQSSQDDSRPQYNPLERTVRATRGAKSQDAVIGRALPSLKAPVQQVPGEQVEQPSYSSYDDALEAINNAYPTESDEDREKREKREKSQRLMAAIGDVFTSFSEGYDRASGKQVADGKSYTQQTDDRLMALEKVRQADAKSRVAALERLQQLKYQQQRGDELRKYQLANQEIRREELERQKANDKARDDYRKTNLRLRDLERQRKIANSPGGDVYFKTVQQMLADGYGEEEAHNEAMKELAAYNAANGTNYTISESYDNSGKVRRTVTLKTADTDVVNNRIQETNKALSTPPPAKGSGKTKASKGSGKSGKKKVW